MTPPTLDPETLAALAAAARGLVPPYFDVSVDYRGGWLNAYIRRPPRGRTFGGGIDISRFNENERAAEFVRAVRVGVRCAMDEELRPHREQRERAREAWRRADTSANADAYREACTEFELESARLFGTYIPERSKS